MTFCRIRKIFVYLALSKSFPYIFSSTWCYSHTLIIPKKLFLHKYILYLVNITENPNSKNLKTSQDFFIRDLFGKKSLYLGNVVYEVHREELYTSKLHGFIPKYGGTYRTDIIWVAAFGCLSLALMAILLFQILYVCKKLEQAQLSRTPALSGQGTAQQGTLYFWLAKSHVSGPSITNSSLMKSPQFIKFSE